MNEISQATTRINWLEYGPEVFEKAKIENKPVLLAISAVWCHWCHVQDKTTYSDPGVIRIINRDYVPIRVDNDRRPDINRRYNMGGWPTTAFLTPTGDVRLCLDAKSSKQSPATPFASDSPSSLRPISSINYGLNAVSVLVLLVSRKH